METGVIYKITNKQTGKVYIGQARDCKRKNGIPYRYGSKGRWNDHVSSSVTSLTPLAQDISKYGKDSFLVEDIEKAELNLLDALEAKWIEELNSLAPKGYNVMRHSQNKHRDKSNIVSFFKGRTQAATLKKIRKEGEYKLIYCYLELEDGSQRRLVFGHNTGKTFNEA
jgi:group I intron endonuclease